MHVIVPLLGIVVVYSLLGILAFAVWIWALINAITNPRLSGGEKIAWILVIILLNFLGALIYLIAGKRS